MGLFCGAGKVGGAVLRGREGGWDCSAGKGRWVGLFCRAGKVGGTVLQGREGGWDCFEGQGR